MSDLLSALESVTLADLDRIKQEIESLERHILALRSMARVVETRLNGAVPRRAATKRDPPGSESRAQPSNVAEEVFDLISREGSLPLEVLSKKLGRSRQALGVAITRSGWFQRTSDGDIAIKKT